MGDGQQVKSVIGDSTTLAQDRSGGQLFRRRMGNRLFH
jgi:hypothetical protein